MSCDQISVIIKFILCIHMCVSAYEWPWVAHIYVYVCICMYMYVMYMCIYMYVHIEGKSISNFELEAWHLTQSVVSSASIAVCGGTLTPRDSLPRHQYTASVLSVSTFSTLLLWYWRYGRRTNNQKKQL